MSDGDEPGFRPRGKEVTRLESFSDAVFAFAVTLIVVSLEVPRSFDELRERLASFPAFFFCFALLAQVWYHHYRYFRRYGLQDLRTIILNFVLLFVVLFYVYPLKYTFTGMFGARDPTLTADGLRLVFVLYGVGTIAVFGTLALMYANALRFRQVLALSPLEVFDTRSAVIAHLACGSVAIVSITLACTVPDRWIGLLAGFSYCLLGPVMTVQGMVRGTQRRKLEGGAASPARPGRDDA